MELERACIYEDGRCHACFEDGSGLILHPGAQFVSLFSSSGELTRQVTSCVTGMGKQKVLKTIQLYNSLSHTPVSILSEDIYQITTKEAKLAAIHWLNPGYLSIIDKFSK